MIGPKELKLAKLSLAMVEQLMPQDDKSTAMQIYSFLVCNGVDWRLLYARVDFEGWPTVNLFGKQINKNVWNGLSYIFTTILWCHLDWWNTVQVQSHKQYCCRKAGEPPCLKPHPKHTVMVHVWAGSSWNGPTDIWILQGRMNADFYIQILQNALLAARPCWWTQVHARQWPKRHLSARTFFENNGINWWRTPPESRDANPIENRNTEN